LQDAHGDTTAKTVANWLSGPLQKEVSSGKLTWEAVTAASTHITKLAAMVSEQQVSSTAAKEILSAVILENRDPQEIAKEKNLLQLSDSSELEAIVKEVLAANEKAAADVAAGEMKAIGFLVGQTMKQSGGKANPGLVQQIIKKQLGL
jgi:aspartyl-tRNA(Asn)/glutamyl-tRNA(Gln) amidotransferase subunit B